jgi:GNAT superfamily N-acetyltransferase
MKPQPFDVFISEEVRHDERNLIVSSWRHSMRDSPEGEMRPDAYRAWFESLVARYLGTDESRIMLPAGWSLLTVRRADKPGFVVSWALVEQSGWLLYMSTKADFRGCGFGSLLLGEAIERAGHNGVVFSVRPRKRTRLWLEMFGCHYQPQGKQEHHESSERSLSGER